MKKLLFLALTGLLTGCSTTSRGLMDPMELASLGLALGGGAIGYTVTDDKSKETQVAATVGSAAAGYLIGKFLQGKLHNDNVEEFNAGYSLGSSNAAKTQYWIIQNRQKEDEWSDRSKSQVQYKYYSFPGSKYAPDGSKLVDHDVLLRVVE